MEPTVVRCRPYIFLRCAKCKSKTPHVIIRVTKTGKELKEGYECQECGETKSIYELFQ